jgi:hypothetical protein
LYPARRQFLFFPKVSGHHESFEQVWFPGVHADIGGGYPEEEAGPAKITLEWMLHEAQAQGLHLNETIASDLLSARKPCCKPDPLATLHNSLSGFWKCMELLPRRSWTVPPGAMRWRGPNLGRERPRPDGTPTLHQSALDRTEGMPESYLPRILNGPYTVQPWTRIL